jgi:plasmid stability protein
MATLVLRNVPDEVYQALKEAAGAHRRSMTQEAIVALEYALGQDRRQTTRPGLEESLEWLRREVWSLPVLDDRSDEEILGYNRDGHFD